MSLRSLDAKTAGAGVKLLVFLVVTAFATAGLALTIANIGFGNSHEYKAVFSDVTGVETGDDVRISGVRVGEVRAIQITEARGGPAAEVTFTVDAKQTLATSTRAAIRYRNLVGQRYLALSEGPGANAPLTAGSTIPIGQTTPALDLTVLFNGFKPLFAALSPKDVNQLSFEIIQVLQGESGNVESLLAHTASLTSTLADKEKVIDDLVDNLNVVLGTVAERDEKLSDLVVELQRFVSGLSGDRKAIGDSLTAIVALEKQTGDLLKDARPDLLKDIGELRVLAGTLERNRPLIERTLKRMPEKLNAITRTATYGSWFNFYMCDFETQIILPNGQELPRTSLHVTDGRCQR